MAEHRNVGQASHIRRATLRGTGLNDQGQAKVAPATLGGAEVGVGYGVPLYTNSGAFIGTAPNENTVVSIAHGEGGEWFMLSPIIPKLAFNKLNIDGDALLITDGVNRINLKPTGNQSYISLGSGSSTLKIDADPKNNRNIISDNFNFKFSVGEGSISVDGIVLRDLNVIDLSFNYDEQRRSSHTFQNDLKPVTFDPKNSPNISTINNGKTARNPTFVEKRESVYEFAYSFNVGSDAQESLKYSNQNPVSPTLTYNRRAARTDVFSLSLEAPNYLMETIKGTGVDIYGNILDLNRNVLPAGKETDLSFDNKDKLDAYKRIRAIERRSLSYHFEINARKGPSINGVDTFDPHQIVPPPDITLSDNFSRPRSRFFFDVDKEGQFKLNIPASSETGNIPYLTRYENASTIDFSQGNSTDANQFSLNGQAFENKTERRDVYLDSFAFNGGSISVNDPENTTAFTSPIDRLTTQAIKHGTVYHDILNILSYFQSSQQDAILQFEYAPVNTAISTLTWPDTFVSPAITISGSNANAGGRSGSLNFDGMVEFNIGANTVDKQSMWLDTQGAILGNIGRDLNNVSMGFSLTGDLLIQVGGCDVGGPIDASTNVCTNGTDTRFLGKNLAFRPGAIDVRVIADNGEATVLRIDNTGVTVTTPSDLRLVAGQQVLIKGTQINLDAEEITLYSGDPNSARSISRSNNKQVP